MYSMGVNIANAYQIFKAMTWYGLLTIWTRYVPASPFPTLCLSQCRLSMDSILPVLLSASVCVNSEADVAIGGYSQHRTRFHLTF